MGVEQGDQIATHEKILGLLDSDPDFGTPGNNAGVPNDSVDDSDVHQEEDDEIDNQDDYDEEDADESDDDEDLESEDDEDDTDEDESDEDDIENEIFEVPGEDGKPVEVTLKELVNGYFRQSDYTKKTQAVAEERREVQKERTEVSQLRANLHQQIEQFKGSDQQRLEELNKTNWTELKQTDPEQYVLLKAEKADLLDQISQAEADQKKLIEQQQAENLKAFNDYKEQADTFLRSDKGIPGWGDAKAFPKIKEALRNAGVELGYSEEELAVAVDPRALKTLWMASEYMKMQNNIQKAKIQRKAKVPKVTQPTASKGKVSGKRKKLMQRARQTGSVVDAASAIVGLLDD